MLSVSAAMRVIAALPVLIVNPPTVIVLAVIVSAALGMRMSPLMVAVFASIESDVVTAEMTMF